MSRIAKDPVVIPDSVTVTAEGNTMKFKGPKGELSLDVHESVGFSIEDSNIQIIWKSKEEAAMAGTMRSLVNNYVLGVSEGYSKTITFIQLNTLYLKMLKQNQRIRLNLVFRQIISRCWGRFALKLEHSDPRNLTKAKESLLMESML